MKKILFLVKFLFVFLVNGYSQNIEFKNVNEFSDWIMNYYKNPKPDNLYTAFEYGLTNKEIEMSGSRNLIMHFFSSIFRDNLEIQKEFYEKLEGVENQNLRYGFVFSLWYANTEKSFETIRLYRNLKVNKKDIENIDSLLKTKPKDLFNEPITNPSELDMLWANFFATGKEKSILKIIKVLENIDSENYNEKILASAARWSLRNNAYIHKEIYNIVSNKAKKENQALKNELNSILKEVDEKLKE